jgi:hypothetical protein
MCLSFVHFGYSKNLDSTPLQVRQITTIPMNAILHVTGWPQVFALLLLQSSIMLFVCLILWCYKLTLYSLILMQSL